jgi:hypothetical protein
MYVKHSKRADVGVAVQVRFEQYIICIDIDI